MNDALLVRGLQRIRDLTREVKRFSNRQRTTLEALGQSRTFNDFKNQTRQVRRFFETVDRSDVRVAQRGEQLRLSLKSRAPIGVADKRARQHLDRHIALQARVSRAKDFTHSPRAYRGDHLVRTNHASRIETHVRLSYSTHPIRIYNARSV